MPVLTILDTLSVQGYVFGSNRLKENIGGSELVKRATGQWVKELLPPQNNVVEINKGMLRLDDRRLEENQLQAEVVYSGGGNTVILFNALETAKEFTERLSRKIIESAPGLELAVLHKEFNWAIALGGYKTGLMFEAFKELEALKRNRQATRPLAGLGVAAVCQSTGQPANTIDQDGNPISAEIRSKLDIVPEANSSFNWLIADPVYQFEFPLELDHLGRSRGDSSYVGVVHADGNGMGQRLEVISGKYSRADQNREYLDALRQFSFKVNRASIAALKRLMDEVRASIRLVRDPKGSYTVTIMEKVPLTENYLPIRPLVFGGDDLTFVCDGRLALTMTEFYLRAFEEETRKVELDNVHACAGIAVVKSHYPFARAYQLAETLCKNAKDRVRDSGKDYSALDWHFTAGGIMGSLSTIREREYKLPDGSELLMRPLALDAAHGDWQNWPNFKTLVNQFSQEWSQGRNKIKQFREALRLGQTGYRQFLNAQKGVTVPRFTTHHQNAFDNGFIGKQCIHYDAIEAMDFFVALHSDAGQEEK